MFSRCGNCESVIPNNTGICYCVKNFKLGKIEFHSDKTTPTITRQGWQCPICKKVLSPDTCSCDCHLKEETE